MAYRKLEVADVVRVVDNGPNHGRDAVVIEALENSPVVKVAVSFGRNTRRAYEEIWINSKYLLVRHSDYEFINDGKLDEEARSKHYSNHTDDDDEISDEEYEDELDDGPCGDCACCEWHRKNSK